MWHRRKRKSAKPFPKFFAEVYGGDEAPSPFWFVYVIQTTQLKPGQKVGFTYVGATNNPARRLRQHNGELPGGARFTSKYHPWVPRALWGPYKTKNEALRAEWTLKHQHRGEDRVIWTERTVRDKRHRRGHGPDHPWVADPSWTAD